MPIVVDLPPKAVPVRELGFGAKNESPRIWSPLVTCGQTTAPFS